MLSVDDLFKGRHFDRKIIVLCVRRYLRIQTQLPRSRGNDGGAGFVVGPSAPPVLRSPREWRVGRCDDHGRADEAAVGRRGRRARSTAAGAPDGAQGDGGRRRAGFVRSLGARAAAHLRQIKIGRGDPLRPIASSSPRTLSRRRPRRNRLQHRRAGDPAPGHHAQELTLRGSRRPRTDMGLHRHHAFRPAK
jgi:hypothetical protein